MKKRFSTYVIPLVILIGLIFSHSFQRQAVFTEDFNQISSLNISCKGESKTYSMDKDKDKIWKLYGNVVNTKVIDHKNPEEMDRQVSDPYFTIEVCYNDGKKDLIKSTETGNFIYKIYDGSGSWIGGENTKLLGLVK